MSASATSGAIPQPRSTPESDIRIRKSIVFVGYDTAMTSTIVLASIMAGAVISLLRAVRVEDQTQQVLSKTTASAAFVVLGIVRWSTGDLVGAWIIAGLALSATGDLCLLWDRSFDAGLISFLLGHLAYIVGYWVALPMRQWPLVTLVPLAVAGLAASRWLWPHLGRRGLPVLLYIIAISVMVWGGVSTVVGGELPWTAAAGASLFYLSDLLVARHRFVHATFLNRALGLPTYYLGQVLLALTIGAV
jgi:uncharacterized membrane protein YhhN